jgi:sensor histidine kinase YesM
MYASTLAYAYIGEFRATLQCQYRIHSFRTELAKHASALDGALKDSDSVDSSYLGEMQGNLRNLVYWLDRDATASVRAWFEVNALRNALAVYSDKANRAVAQKLAANDDYYIPYYNAQRIGMYMGHYLDNLQNILLSDGWMYYSMLDRKAEMTRWIILCSFFFIALVSLRFVFLFSKRFSGPIHSLAEISRRMASGDLDVALLAESEGECDEVGVLTSSFNTMSRNIRSMVEGLKNTSVLERKLHDEEMEKESTLRSLREAQLISLQTQINPHFLFNTLNTISRQARLEKADQTASLIQSLANLFRYSLLSYRQTVTLAQELSAVREYLDLQKRRFGNRLEYRIDGDVPLESIAIPALVIQPFVENAVCHGIEPLIAGGFVRVSVRRRDSLWRVRVFDNGCGMDAETLKCLRDGAFPPNGAGETSGLGFANVLKRIGLFYSGLGSVSVYSRKGRGTLAVISIPAAGEA